jgi:hypothetical protein
MNSSLPRDPLSRPGEPTDAPPGSVRKIRVLTERASRREALFHPQDNLKRQPLEAPADPPDGADQEIDADLVGGAF